MGMPVMFRKWSESKGGGVIAIFPTIPGGMSPYECQMYETVGQHGSGDPQGVIRATKPAKPREYASLLKELHKIGYRKLDVYSRYQRGWIDVVRRELQKVKSQ